MHHDYDFGRGFQERSALGWQGYRGAVPAKVTMGLLGAGLFWHLVLLVGKLVAPGAFTGPALGAMASLVTLGLYVLTAIAFLIWFYRAYQTVNLAEGTAHSPDQAVWTFLIPVLNLYRPYQIATEIWRKSSPGGADLGHSGLIIAWWAFWVLGRGCPLFMTVTLMPDDQGVLHPMVLAFGFAELALTTTAIAVVRTLDGRIRDRQGQRDAPATF